MSPMTPGALLAPAGVAHPEVGVVLGATLQSAADSGAEASGRLTMVIIGLLVLAVVITAATVVFWRLTRPDPVSPEPGIRWVPPREPAREPSPGGVATGEDGGPSGAEGPERRG